MVTKENWQDVLALAGVHEVAPLVAHGMRLMWQQDQGSGPGQGPIRDSWNDGSFDDCKSEIERLHAVSVIQQGLQDAEMEAVLAVLSPIPALVLKGPSLAARYYPAGARLSRDLDLHIREADYPSARTALMTLGYRVMDEYDEKIQRHQSKDVAFIRHEAGAGDGNAAATRAASHTSGKTWSVELHWRLTEPGAPDLRQAAVWERAESVRHSGASFMTPSPEHTLLLLALNLRKQRFARLKTVCDLTRVIAVEAHRIDWQLLHDEAHRAGLCALLRHSLTLSSHLMCEAPPPLPPCSRSHSVVLGLLSRLATADTVLAEGRTDDPAKYVSGLIPFFSLDNLLTSLHLAYDRLMLSPELASYYRAGMTHVYGSRRQYWKDTARRFARAVRVLSRSTSGIG